MDKEQNNYSSDVLKEKLSKKKNCILSDWNVEIFPKA